MDIKLGAHLSIAGGYHLALERIKANGGNCLQIFSSSPRGWQMTTISDNEKQQFLKLKKQLQIDPVYFHASYLVNLADNGRIGHLSKQSLIAELDVASRLEIRGSIVHLGSFKNNQSQNSKSQLNSKYQILIKHIKEILRATPKNTRFIIENAGNRKIGQTIDEIATIIKDVSDERVRVCLDTCHLFSAGYALTDKKKLDDFLQTFEFKIGLRKLELWHTNDSRDPLGTLRDRHENIGQGTIGLETFRLLLNHPSTKHLPFIIETPGFDKRGPDKKNIDILKSLVYD